MPLFLLKFWKPIAAAILLAAVAFMWHHQYTRGVKAGKAAEHALWQADTARRDAAAAKAALVAKQAQNDAITDGQEIAHALQEKLAAAESGRSDLERLLQRTRAQVRASEANRATDKIIAHQASESERDAAIRQLDEQLASATAGLRTEAGMNADRLDSLVAFLNGQKVCPLLVE